MAIPGSVNPMMLGGGEAAVYPINQSLRLNSADAYTFRRTVGSASTSQRKFTVSIWSKRGVINSGTTSSFGRQMIVYTGASNGAGNLFGLEWREDEVACIFNGAGSIYPQTVAKFRDPSAWYHIVVAVDTDQTTAADRCKVYVNGVQQTLTGTLPGSGFDVSNGASTVQTIGELGSLRSNQYVAEAYYINDQQLEPTDFAETNDDGVWIPKAYEGTFTGTNSYYLKFDSAATNGIGHDHSGNSNTFTTTNFTTSGTGTDVMSDTPTNNFCVLNPLYYTASGITQSEGNLRVSFPSAPPNGMRGGTLATTNAFYFEAEATAASSNQVFVGVQPPDWANNTTTYPGKGPDGWGYQASGAIVNNNSTVTTVSSWTAGDIIGVACDPSSGTIQFFKNGTSVYSGTSVANVPMTIGVAQVGGSGNSGTFVVNCGQRAFEYTPPTGFEALNTSNLPAPTIKDGSDYFNTVLWTGNATARDITTGHNSNFTWIKHRSTAENHNIYDILRGTGERLESNSTDQEVNYTDRLTAFNSDGFSLGTGYNNTNTTTYVGWSWAGGGAGVSNTDGTITSTVSASTTSGFSIVTFTGNGTAGATVGHDLGVEPKMLFWKSTNSGTTSDHWTVYHAEMDATSPEDYAMHLNLTNARNQSSTYWNLTAPTSTVFTLGYNAPYLNVSGRTYVAYCFAEVENYSRFGKYTGNGNADGPFVYCGFRPAWVLIKNADSATDWHLFDTARDPSNEVTQALYPDTSGAEDTLTNNEIDILSNGFKLRSAGSSTNGNGNTLIFAAFAENPFGGSGVSPATAR